MNAAPKWSAPAAPNFGNGWSAPTQIATPNDAALKRLFALNVMAYPHSLLRAAEMTTHDVNLQTRIVSEWIYDDIVKGVFVEYDYKYDPMEIPTREAMVFEAMRVYERSYATDDKVKALTLAAKLAGHITSGTQVNLKQTNVQHNGVMLVKDHGSDDEWETKATRQQAKLIEHASG